MKLPRGDEAVIRVAVLADAAAIATVHVHSWQWAYRGVFPDEVLNGLSATLERRTVVSRDILLKQSEDEQTWVVEVDGRAVGFTAVGPSRDPDAGPSTGEVYAIYLERDAAGKGLGRALFEQAVKFLQERSCAVATLWVLASNDRARRFYEKAGWQPDGTSKMETIHGAELEEVRYLVTFSEQR